MIIRYHITEDYIIIISKILLYLLPSYFYNFFEWFFPCIHFYHLNTGHNFVHNFHSVFSFFTNFRSHIPLFLRQISCNRYKSICILFHGLLLNLFIFTLYKYCFNCNGWHTNYRRESYSSVHHKTWYKILERHNPWIIEK